MYLILAKWFIKRFTFVLKCLTLFPWNLLKILTLYVSHEPLRQVLNHLRPSIFNLCSSEQGVITRFRASEKLKVKWIIKCKMENHEQIALLSNGEDVSKGKWLCMLSNVLIPMHKIRLLLSMEVSYREAALLKRACECKPYIITRSFSKCPWT